MSSISQFIPESVKKFWTEYRAAFKSAEKEQLDSNEISEHVERAGWGVETAEQRHAEQASKSTYQQARLILEIVHQPFVL